MEYLRQKAYAFLRWSERYFKTDMVYLGSGGFWLFFGQGAGILSSLILAIGFANLLPPEEYGNYKYVLSVASVIGGFTLTGLTTAINRAAARGSEGTLRYGFKKMLLWSGAATMLSCGAALYYFMRENTFLAYSFLIIGATSPLISAASLYRPFLIGKKEFRQASVSGMLQSTIPAFSVLTMLLIQAPLLVLIATYFFSNAIVVYLLYRTAAKKASNNAVEPNTDHLGKHLSIMGLATAVSGKIDSILVFQLLGGAELALFSLATKIPDTIRGALKNVDALAMPKFAHKTKEEMKRAVWSKTVITFFATIVITGAYFVTAPFIFSTLFPQYIEVFPYTQVYAFILPLSFLLAAAYFDSQAIVRERYVITFTDIATRIIFSFIGIYFFGVWGAIIAHILNRVAKVGMTAAFIMRH